MVPRVTVCPLPVSHDDSTSFPDAGVTPSYDTSAVTLPGPPPGAACNANPMPPDSARSDGRTTHATFATPSCAPARPPGRPTRFVVPSLRDVLHQAMSLQAEHAERIAGEMSLQGDNATYFSGPETANTTLPPVPGGGVTLPSSAGSAARGSAGGGSPAAGDVDAAAVETETVILIPEVGLGWYRGLSAERVREVDAAVADDVGVALGAGRGAVTVGESMADPNGTLLTVRLRGRDRGGVEAQRERLDALVARGLLRLTRLTEVIRGYGWVPEAEAADWQREELVCEKLCIELSFAVDAGDLAKAEATLALLLQSKYPNARNAALLATIQKFIPTATLHDVAERCKSLVVEYIMSRRPAPPAAPPMPVFTLTPHPALAGVDKMLAAAASAAADIEAVCSRQKEQLYVLQRAESAPNVIYQGKEGRVLAAATPHADAEHAEYCAASP